MKKVLVLGAGMVVKPLVHYLLKNNVHITLASRTKEKADKVIEGFTNSKSIAWTIDQIDILEELIAKHDLIVSLLPYKYHIIIAKKCILYKKDMLTTSYISPEMKVLNLEAKKSGIIILNEIGLDPGYDHMTAMKIIDRIHDQGGKIDEFYSLCGALCAPEQSNNPFRYKFSWSPKGVVMASNNNAQFLKNGEIVKIDSENLFKNPLQIYFPEIEHMQVYPNRDSLPYIEIYGIPEVKTMYRGTFRYKKWCEAMDLLKNLKLTSYDEIDSKGKSYAQITAELNNFRENQLKEDIKSKFNIDDKHIGLIAIEWLGVLDIKIVSMNKTTPFDLIADLMIQKMMMNDSEKDMVIMQHIFNITKSNGQKETIVSRMIEYGNNSYSSIARTVALPAAIGVKLILNKTITDKGVLIPIKKSIYTPILDELKKLNISMEDSIEDLFIC